MCDAICSNIIFENIRIGCNDKTKRFEALMVMYFYIYWKHHIKTASSGFMSCCDQHLLCCQAACLKKEKNRCVVERHLL